MRPAADDSTVSTVIEQSVVRCKIHELLSLLENPVHDSRPSIAAGFDWLMTVAQSLPLTTNEFGFASNWITSARQLWEQGEHGAARYQVKMVRRRLNL
jgi:hypothetical protein